VATPGDPTSTNERRHDSLARLELGPRQLRPPRTTAGSSTPCSGRREALDEARRALAEWLDVPPDAFAVEA
jgi:hypothetical protein